GLMLVAQETLQNAPTVPLRNVITSFTGLRSVGETGDFIIKETAKNFISLCGIESPGLTASPAIAKYIVRLLQKKYGLTKEKNSNFCGKRKAYYRFSEMTPQQKNRIIKQNSDFGTIICRCEGISKGEIIEALTVNPPANDLDGVKRRTRSGMGRCQGGFCSTAIVEIISSIKGIPFEEVTKSGKGSVINFEKTK
ncbi:MAG: FAD-dependent oxidoreductase, partial [Clostridia bacterium]|nr:FAD-dependent oxidoreductase [Clostridia bacterium]